METSPPACAQHGEVPALAREQELPSDEDVHILRQVNATLSCYDQRDFAPQRGAPRDEGGTPSTGARSLLPHVPPRQLDSKLPAFRLDLNDIVVVLVETHGPNSACSG